MQRERFKLFFWVITCNACIRVGVMKRNGKIDFDQLSESIDNAFATSVCAFKN